MIEFKKRKNLNEQINTLTRKTRIFSTIRFVIAVMAIFFVICLLSIDNFVLYLTLSLISILLLVLAIIFTNPFYNKLKLYQGLESIYKKHDNRRNGFSGSFSDDGRDFIDYNDYKQLDIDLFGPKSLYQYLNAAKSKLGRTLVANQLKEPMGKPLEFRKCVKYLAENEDSLLLEASLLNIAKEDTNCDYDELLGICKERLNIPKLGWILMGISYLLFFTMLIILMVNKLNPFYSFFILLINFFIANKFSSNKVFRLPSTKYSNLISAYEKVAKDIINSDIDEPYFNELKKVIQNEINSIKLFKKTFEMLSYRKNIIFSIIGNCLFYVDYFIILKFNHNNKYISSIEESIAAIAEIELMLSLATIGIDNEVYCLPEYKDEFYMEDGYHPLVKNCVKNSFVLGGGIILTGSNMSGKTTFQRTIGINQILFNAGGLVCANYFTSKYLNVVTSLRANDMLQEGISTFYAEIKRMKKIVEEIGKSSDTLVLIDEIFKGTNAKDRIYGSLEVIKKLSETGCLFIITTHDFELCEAPNILNYHFSEEYNNDEISFDYLVKEGKCQTTNARYLLKMSGII